MGLRACSQAGQEGQSWPPRPRLRDVAGWGWLFLTQLNFLYLETNSCQWGSTLPGTLSPLRPGLAQVPRPGLSISQESCFAQLLLKAEKERNWSRHSSRADPARPGRWPLPCRHPPFTP